MSRRALDSRAPPRLDRRAAAQCSSRANPSDSWNAGGMSPASRNGTDDVTWTNTRVGSPRRGQPAGGRATLRIRTQLAVISPPARRGAHSDCHGIVDRDVGPARTPVAVLPGRSVLGGAGRLRPR